MDNIVRHTFGQAWLGLILTAWAIVLSAPMPAAQAQNAPVILVVNQAQIISESKAGKDLAGKAQGLQETIAKEIQNEFNTLKKREEDLLAQQTLLSSDVFKERAEKLRVDQQNFEITRQVKAREYQASVAKGRAEIAKAVEPIYADIIKERGATIMVGRSQLIFASPDADVTADVMKRLDDKLTTVAFERVKVEVKQGEQ